MPDTMISDAVLTNAYNDVWVKGILPQIGNG